VNSDLCFGDECSLFFFIRHDLITSYVFDNMSHDSCLRCDNTHR
jgi:hypothetical protein